MNKKKPYSVVVKPFGKTPVTLCEFSDLSSAHDYSELSYITVIFNDVKQHSN